LTLASSFYVSKNTNYSYFLEYFLKIFLVFKLTAQTLSAVVMVGEKNRQAAVHVERQVKTTAGSPSTSKQLAHLPFTGASQKVQPRPPEPNFLS